MSSRTPASPAAMYASDSPAEIARGVHLACGAIVNACTLVWHRYGTTSALGQQCDRLLPRVNHATYIADEIAPEHRRDPPPPDPEGYIPQNTPRARPHPHRMTKAEHDRLGLDLTRARLRLLRAQVQLGKSDARGLVTLLLAGLDRLRCALDDAECREHGTTDCYYGREHRVAPESTGEHRVAPESTGEERREAWRVRHGVRPVKRHPLYCPCLLGTRRLLCDKHRAIDPRDRGNECDPYSCCLTTSGFVDHARQWIRNGRRAFFTTETYLARVPEGLAAVMAEHRIAVFLHPADEGWHYAPRCRLYVFMQRQDAAEYARLEPRAERL